MKVTASFRWLLAPILLLSLFALVAAAQTALWTATPGTASDIYKTTTGNVGIGVEYPAAPLDVGGTLQAISGAVPAGNYGVTVAGASGAARDIFDAGQVGFSNGFTVQYTGSAMKYGFIDGKVGIGTSTPATTLDVVGSAGVSGNIGIGTTTPARPLDINGNYLGLSGSSGESRLIMGNRDSAALPGMITSDNGWVRIGKGSNFSTGNGGTFSEFLTISSGGSVGVGTSSPSRLFDINGNNFGLTASSGPTRFIMGNRDSSALPGIVASDNGNVRIGKGSTFSSSDGGTFSEFLTILSGGNVGIGTTSPGRLFDINGNNAGLTASSGATKLIMGNRDSSALPGIITSDNGNVRIGKGSNFGSSDGGTFSEFLTISSGGGVGVGTSSPTRLFDINGNNVGLTAGGGATKLIMGNRDSAALPGILTSDNGNVRIGKGTNFGASDGGTFSESVTVLSNGNVGIGTSSPAAKLDIAGNVTVSGNIAAKYQDLAEWVPASSPIAPGTVVIVDVSQRNAVTPSVRAYDTRIAGVVSAEPGIVLGEGAENKVRVATTGRVRVHVDASQGAIHAGDLLVTSDKIGTAMRSVPVELLGIVLHRPGTLIGKALESMDEGEGDILVLLSLQ